MGADKARLRVGGRPMIERVVEAVSTVADEIRIIVADDAPYRYLGLPLHADLVPGAGPLAGLHTGLAVMAAPAALFVACDMPFLHPAVLAYLRDHLDDHDALVPRTPDGIHPLHAVYRRSCLLSVTRLLDGPTASMRDLCAVVRTGYVEADTLTRLDPTLRSLMNVNTPAELVEAERVVAGPA